MDLYMIAFGAVLFLVGRFIGTLDERRNRKESRYALWLKLQHTANKVKGPVTLTFFPVDGAPKTLTDQDKRAVETSINALLDDSKKRGAP